MYIQVFLYVEKVNIHILDTHTYLGSRYVRTIESIVTLYTVQCTKLPYTYKLSNLYTVYLFTPGRKGGELTQREIERGNKGEYRSQSWVKNNNMMEKLAISSP